MYWELEMLFLLSKLTQIMFSGWDSLASTGYPREILIFKNKMSKNSLSTSQFVFQFRWWTFHCVQPTGGKKKGEILPLLAVCTSVHPWHSLSSLYIPAWDLHFRMRDRKMATFTDNGGNNRLYPDQTLSVKQLLSHVLSLPPSRAIFFSCWFKLYSLAFSEFCHPWNSQFLLTNTKYPEWSCWLTQIRYTLNFNKFMHCLLLQFKGYS